MEKRASGGGGQAAKIAVISAAVLAVIAGIYFLLSGLGLFGGRGGTKNMSLSSALKEWTAQWADGDESSLSSGLVFGVSASGKGKQSGGEDMDLSPDELKAVMEEQYGGLIEPEEAPEGSESLFPIVMRHTTVTYELPSDIADGQTVTFEITGPDMAAIVELLDENASQAELFSRLEGILSGDGWPQRTVSARSQIEALDDGYRLESSFEVIDGLYGGLLSLVGDALPRASAQ